MPYFPTVYISYINLTVNFLKVIDCENINPFYIMKLGISRGALARKTLGKKYIHAGLECG